MVFWEDAERSCASTGVLQTAVTCHLIFLCKTTFLFNQKEHPQDSFPQKMKHKQSFGLLHLWGSVCSLFRNLGVPAFLLLSAETVVLTGLAHSPPSAARPGTLAPADAAAL